MNDRREFLKALLSSSAALALPVASGQVIDVSDIDDLGDESENGAACCLGCCCLPDAEVYEPLEYTELCR